MLTCRICGCSDVRFLFRVEEYDIDRCPACEFVQVREQPAAEVLDRIYAALHLKHMTYRNEAAANAENQRRLKLMRTFVPDGARVLDAGCAMGDFVTLAKDHVRIEGMDVSAGAIAEARLRNPDLADRLWSGPIEALPAERGSFDAIVLWDVIEHLWDPVEVSRALFSRLSPRGVLLLSTPDAGALAARLMRRRWAFMIPPEHLSLFARKTMRLLFGQLLPGEILHHSSRGKWTNVGFVVYKLDRMLGRIIPEAVSRGIASSPLGNLMVYVPTADIQYLVIRKLD